MFRKTILIMVLVIAGNRAARADTPEQAKKAITAIYAQESREVARKNPYAVYEHQTVDYVAISKEGARFDKETMFQSVLKLTTLKAINASIVITNFVLKGTKGNIAVVRTKSRVRLTKEDPASKRTSTLTNDSIQEDLWVKQGNNWLVRQSKELSSTTQISKGK